LRAKIWRAAAFTPTTSGFSCERKHRTDDLVFHGHEFIPAFLSTSKEAREEGSKYYQICTLYTLVWHPELRTQVVRYRKAYFNLQVHEFTASTGLIMDLELYSKSFDVRPQDMKKNKILTLTTSGTEPDRYRNVHIPVDWRDFFNTYFPDLKVLSILVEEWVVSDGVQQGVAQDLWRAELHDKYRKHWEEVLKEVKSKPKLRILFKDEYDADTAPAPAEFTPGAGGYFSRIEPPE
jgi:hypothetical protein